MSDAKKCDLCKGLYETENDDNKATVVEPRQGYNGTAKIIGFLKLFRSRGFRDEDTDPMDHCQACTEKAVRKFMVKFGIPERRGESFQCHIRVGKRQVVHFEEGPALSKDDNDAAQDKNRDFFAGFNGKRVRITVEVL